MDRGPNNPAEFTPLIRNEYAPPTHPIWIGWCLIAGLAVGAPSGYLLAYLAALPFMLGLFFFLALGLITGATMFRFGSRANLPSDTTLWIMGTSVATIMLLVSLWAEYKALPASVQKAVRESYFESFTDARRTALGDKVLEHIETYLATQYPPGGLIGYLRWAALEGRLQCPRFVRPISIDPKIEYKPASVGYSLPYKRGPWLFRVGVCFLLLHWTILSQMVALRATRKQPVDRGISPDPTP